MPERLYKYQRFDVQAIENLKTRTLWFSPPSLFNDPYDCATTVAATELSDQDLARAVEYIQGVHGLTPDQMGAYAKDGRFADSFRQAIATGGQGALDHERTGFYHSRGVACLAESHDNFLMWSHYADGHRGFCLEFDAQREPFSKAMPVVYSNTLPEVNVVSALAEQDGDAMLRAMVLTKATCWSYEREWRIVHTESATKYTYPWDALLAVHFGAAMSPAHREILALVLHGSPTALRQMKQAPGEFAVRSEAVAYQPFQYRPDAG